MTVVSCQCGQRFRAAPQLLGKQVACPSCGAAIQVPAPAKIPVYCKCGRGFQADFRLAGKSVTCPSCQAALHVPNNAATPAPQPAPLASDPLGPTRYAPLPATRVTRPAPASNSGLNRWIIGAIAGGIAFVIMFIVAYEGVRWITREVADEPQADEQAFVEGTNDAEQSARDKLETELARLRSAGEPVTPDEMERFYSLPAGAQDTTPLWESASSTFYSDEFDADAAGIPCADPGMGYKVPPPGRPWGELSRAQELLGKYRQPLEQLHEAARSGGAARYPTSFQDGIAMSMPNLMELRASAGVLRLEVMVRLHEGDTAGAAESVNAIFAAGRSLETYPKALARTAPDG